MHKHISGAAWGFPGLSGFAYSFWLIVLSAFLLLMQQLRLRYVAFTCSGAILPGQAASPSLSYQCWSSLLTNRGVERRKSEVSVTRTRSTCSSNLPTCCFLSPLSYVTSTGVRDREAPSRSGSEGEQGGENTEEKEGKVVNLWCQKLFQHTLGLLWSGYGLLFLTHSHRYAGQHSPPGNIAWQLRKQRCWYKCP